MAPRLKTTDIAELLGVHADTVRQWVDEGLIPYYRIGHSPGRSRRTLRFDAAEIEDWLAAQRRPAVTEYVARSRSEQGLSRHVEDPAALGRAVNALAERPKAGDA